MVRIEAESYTTAQNSVGQYTTSDESGIAIRPNAGNVLTYDVDIAAAGTYDLVARVVAPKSGTYSFDVVIDGQTHAFSFDRTSGGWDGYIDITISGVSVPSGAQEIVLNSNSNKFNINYLDLIPVGPPPPPSPGTISFEASSYSVAEDGTAASITLVRAGGSAGLVTVDVALADGTAVAPGDYNGATQTVTFQDGETTKTITVPIVDDSVQESDETVSLSLANATGGATLGTQSTATLTITDDDAPMPPDDIRIMPLGDSITHGWFNTFPGGYRDRLENLFVANDVGFDFVGSESNGPSTLADRNHQGHPGWRIDEIAAQADTWLANESPDVVLLLIGTNDMIQDYNTATAPDRLSSLIDQILGAASQPHVVVASIPPTTNSVNSRVLDYNAEIPGIISTKIAEGKSVSYVDMYSQLTVADLGDRYHPNQGGYNKMAGVWFEELLNVIDDFGQYDAISDEYYVEASVTASDDHSTIISADLVNNSSSARSDLSFRYFVDLTELFDEGYDTSDLLIGNINGPMVGGLTVWDASEDVYYVEADFTGTSIAAGSSANVEFSLGVSSTITSAAWDEANDWSTTSLNGTTNQSRYLPVYDASSLLSGVIPA